MNKECIVVLKMAHDVPRMENMDYIGGDAGALLLAKMGITMALAAGDYDSIEQSEIDLIRPYAAEMEVLNPIKDDSDSEHVIREAISRGYEKIHVYGALGGRRDHEYVNIRLCELFANKVVLYDERNRIEAVGEGTYVLKKEPYKYTSIFTHGEAEVSYIGMKYPLDHVLLTSSDLYGLSNEVLEEEGQLIVHKGSLLLIQAKD